MAAPAVRPNPGERICKMSFPSPFWTYPWYVPTLGLWAIWRGRHHFLLTDQRLIIAKGIVSKSEQSVPLARIQDVVLQRSLLKGGCVQISSAGGGLGVERIGPLTREKARQFGDALSQVVPSHGDGVSTGRATPSASEELHRLAGLRNSGVLSDEEFSSQKVKLLNG
jgi:hypothetical protein